jgi:spore photoproduct lyase
VDVINALSDWEKIYEEVVDLIFGAIDPANIAWISLGALRFTPALKPIIERRFSMSRILGGEIIQCSDGKMRYPRIIREELFRKMNGFIRKHSERVPVYLCMEPSLVWKNTLSTLPSCDLRLRGIFGA